MRRSVPLEQAVVRMLVLDLSAAYARHLERLEPIVAAVAERWELEVEPVPVEA